MSRIPVRLQLQQKWKREMQTPSTIVNMKATYNGCRSINIRHGDAKIPVRVCRDSIISLTKQVIILTEI